jgi:hypothetical protein
MSISLQSKGDPHYKVHSQLRRRMKAAHPDEILLLQMLVSVPLELDYKNQLWRKETMVHLHTIKSLRSESTIIPK